MISINKSFLGIPIVGSVAAGSPLLAVENVEERIEFKGNIFSDSVDYFLRVKGDSMNEVGIIEGDLIAINKKKDVKPGDIIVARINDDVTVTTLFFLDKRKVILRPDIILAIGQTTAESYGCICRFCWCYFCQLLNPIFSVLLPKGFHLCITACLCFG